MISSIRKQLKEIAKEYANIERLRSRNAQNQYVPEVHYMAGAQAAWDLATKVSEDDERDADTYYLQEDMSRHPHERVSKAFLAGRSGRQAAIDEAVRKERERVAKIVRSAPGLSREIFLDEILNPIDETESSGG